MTARLRRWLVLGAAVHVVVFAAGVLAPYDPREQHRDVPYAPPTRLHVVDAEGAWRWPFVHPLLAAPGGGYAEDTRVRLPLCLLARAADSAPGPTWRVVGVAPPGALFILGTDAYGRDVWSRLLHGARTSLAAGLLATAAALALAVALGGLAGFAGGAVDRAVTGLIDLLMSLPWLYLLLAARGVLPLDLDATRAFQVIVLLLAAVGWARPARLVRAEVRQARLADFVVAARALGASPWRVAVRHVLPSAWRIVTTQAAVLVPQFVLAEVTLSFFGVGVAEPAPSWGGLLAAAQRYEVLRSAWWLVLPALALVPVCYIYYRLADALQEQLGR